MQTELYLHKNFFDTQRNKYCPVSEIDSRDNWIEMKTEDEKSLIIYYNLDNPKYMQYRLDWLINISNKTSLYDVLAFPKALLTGLKKDEVGYIAQIKNKCTLNDYIHCETGEKLFKWYFNKTGGISYRLKIAYNIASALQKIHSKGYCLVNICPSYIHLQKFDVNKKQNPIVQFSRVENISSYTYPPLNWGASNYCDPLIFKGICGVSTISDAYSYAVLLFELLTTCHPFIGEDTYKLSQDELSKAIDSGELDYIGNKNSDRNKNEDFDDTQIFIPEDLLILFEKMFVEGKFNKQFRPTIENFKMAIIKSLRKIINCDHKGCQREYTYNKEMICPFCGNITQKVVKACVKKVIYTPKKILIPHDGIKDFSALPIIQENTNFMVIRDGLNKLTPTFFEPDTVRENGNIGLFVYYSAEDNKISIINRFKKLNVNICGKILGPYNKEHKYEYYEDYLSNDKVITIELQENAQINPEHIVQINCEEYGIIRHKWIVTIK